LSLPAAAICHWEDGDNNCFTPSDDTPEKDFCCEALNHLQSCKDKGDNDLDIKKRCLRVLEKRNPGVSLDNFLNKCPKLLKSWVERQLVNLPCAPTSALTLDEQMVVHSLQTHNFLTSALMAGVVTGIVVLILIKMRTKRKNVTEPLL